MKKQSLWLKRLRISATYVLGLKAQPLSAADIEEERDAFLRGPVKIAIINYISRDLEPMRRILSKDQVIVYLMWIMDTLKGTFPGRLEHCNAKIKNLIDHEVLTEFVQKGWVVGIRDVGQSYSFSLSKHDSSDASSPVDPWESEPTEKSTKKTKKLTN